MGAACVGGALQIGRSSSDRPHIVGSFVSRGGAVDVDHTAVDIAAAQCALRYTANIIPSRPYIFQ